MAFWSPFVIFSPTNSLFLRPQNSPSTDKGLIRKKSLSGLSCPTVWYTLSLPHEYSLLEVYLPSLHSPPNRFPSSQNNGNLSPFRSQPETSSSTPPRSPPCSPAKKNASLLPSLFKRKKSIDLGSLQKRFSFLSSS